MAMITIDGKTHDSEQLSDAAKAHVQSIQFVDNRISQLLSESAVCQTARNAYGEALASLLPPPAHPNKKKGVLTLDGKKYALDDMSAEAKAQLQSLQFVDAKLSDLEAERAVFSTARNAYAQALKVALDA